MSGPPYHGRTHSPDGTDPIAGLVDFIDTAVGGASTTGLPVCYASATAFSLAADAAWHKPEWTTFTTNNATVFQQDIGNPEDIHFAAGHYLVGYEIYMATPPTDPDYFSATPSIFGMESFPTPGRAFVGDFSKINDNTMTFTSPANADLGYHRWQEYQVFPPAIDSAGGDGYFHLLLTKASGAAVTLNTIRMFMVRLSGSGDVAGPGDSGIFFDLANVGDWLQVLTTGTNPATVETGWTTYTNTGVSLISDDAKMVIGTSGSGNLYLDSAADIDIEANRNLYLSGLGAGGAQLVITGWDGAINVSGGYTSFNSAGFNVESTGGILLDDYSTGIELNADASVTVSASTGSIDFKTNGVLVAQIRNDGTFHIKTGGTIHADL